MLNLLSSLFGRKSPDKQIEAYRSKVDAINALEAEMEVLSDEDLAAKPLRSNNSWPMGHALKN